MKKFLTKIALYVFPIVAIMYPLDLYFSKSIKKMGDPSGEIEVWEDIYNGTINADIAIYGSSRAACHINPKILEHSFGLRAYNLGMIATSFQLQYFRHIEYIKHNIKPKAIILSVDFFSIENSEYIIYTTTCSYCPICCGTPRFNI